MVHDITYDPNYLKKNFILLCLPFWWLFHHREGGGGGGGGGTGIQSK
jgi:hypothetical protein